MVERDHHADLGPPLRVDLLPAVLRPDALPEIGVLLVVGGRLPRRHGAPGLVGARDRPDEPRVAHVRDGGVVRLMPTRVGYPALGAHPVARAHGVGGAVGALDRGEHLGFEGAAGDAQEGFGAVVCDVLCALAAVPRLDLVF